MQNYDEAKREFNAAMHNSDAIGSRYFPGVKSPAAMMSPEQARHYRGGNFLTDEKWQFRMLAGNSIFVEISHGVMMSSRVYGLTAYHIAGPHAGNRDKDFEASKCCHSIGELVEALRALNSGVAAQPFHVTGEDRQLGAIGICEPFSVTVYATSAEEARETVHRERAETREHTLIKKVEALS